MLERTAGCLEQGSLRCLLPRSKQAIKSRRMLHSGFFQHGGGELDAIPLWQILIRGLDAANDQDERVAPSVLSSSSGLFLDFLYPSNAVNLLRKCSAWRTHNQETYKGRACYGRLGQRLYSSISKDAKPTLDDLHQDSRRQAAENAEVYTGNCFHQELELSRDTAELDASGAILTFAEAWRQFELHPTEDPIDIFELLAYLSTSTSAIDAERAIFLYSKLGKSASIGAHQAAMRSYMVLKDFQNSLKVLKREMAEFGIAAGSDFLFAQAFIASKWEFMLKIWNEVEQFLAKSSSRRIDIWSHINNTPKFQDQALELAQYVNDERDKPAGSSTWPGSVDYQDLASEIVFRATLVDKPLSESSKLLRLLRVLQEWNADTGSRYEDTITRLLNAKRTKLAITCYRQCRQRPNVEISRNLLDRLLKIMVTHHSVLGVQQILNDWSRFYGAPSQSAYRLCLAEFASQGNVKEVHQLWNQYMSSGAGEASGVPTIDADDIVPLMHVHAKRGELPKVIKIFDEMYSKYGLQPSVKNWNVLINAYGKVQDVDGAFARFDQLMESSVKPDGYTIGTLMGICIHRGDLSHAMDLYQLAESLDIERSIAMVDYIVLGHTQEKRLSQAEKICEDAVRMNQKGDKTRMWNFLLTAYAMDRDLENANRILERMKDLRIQYNGSTYAALMQALVMVKQPERAYSILKDVLPEAGIPATQFHYAIVMGGFLAIGELDKVFAIHRRMKRHAVSESVSTRLVAIKTAAMKDQKDEHNHSVDTETNEVRLLRADKLFFEAMNASTAEELVDTQRKGVGRQPLDILPPSAYLDFMIFVYGKRNAFEQVRQLYELSTTKLKPHRKLDPSAKIMSALMAANLHHRDYEGVEKCWELAFSQAKKRGKPISSDAGPKVLPFHRLALTKSLMSLIQAMAQQNKFVELAKTIEQVQVAGFELDNKNWNLYIQQLTRSSKYKAAFELCEAKLMPGWTGWARVRWRSQVRNRLTVRIRNSKKDPRNLRPVYHTLLFLARALLELEESMDGSKMAKYVFNDLVKRCPLTVNAIRTMERSNSELETQVMDGPL